MRKSAATSIRLACEVVDRPDSGDGFAMFGRRIRVVQVCEACLECLEEGNQSRIVLAVVSHEVGKFPRVIESCVVHINIDKETIGTSPNTGKESAKCVETLFYVKLRVARSAMLNTLFW